MTPEGKVTAAIVRHLKALQKAGAPLWFAKLHGGPMQRAGLPDLIVLIDGRLLAIEVKRPGGKASALQAHTLSAMERAGASSVVACSVGDVSRLIEEAVSV
jgi:hypothetical protein